jgi:hypothetical protein
VFKKVDQAAVWPSPLHDFTDASCETAPKFDPTLIDSNPLMRFNFSSLCGGHDRRRS